ncbi:outer membrane protein [Hydrogenovibrio kuenenii]|uniref:outer membrane protein n=1 Tax=Hydrogenovibrio kuenenii TaxID=63658 RepID=UPI00046479EF|nr:outer membrane beta-barrel protein [Hydrogenovibrio kuenenii]
MKKFFIGALTIVSAMSLSNMAQAKESNYYLKAGVGFETTQAVSAKDKETTSSTVYNYGYNYESESIQNYSIDLGLRVNKLYTLEAAYQYTPEFTITSPSVEVNGTLKTQYSTKTQINLSTLMIKNLFSLSEAFKLNWKTKPYLGLGIGMSSYSNKTKSYNNGTQVSEMESKTDTNFVYQGLIGATYPLTKKLDIDLSYAYTNYGKIASSEKVINSSNQMTAIDKPTLTSNQLHIAVRYDF